VDQVSYIMPASTNLLTGNPVMAPGTLTEGRPIGDYVEVGQTAGQRRPTNNVALQDTSFETLTNKIAAGTVQSEVARAFQVLAELCNVSFSAAQAQGRCVP